MGYRLRSEGQLSLGYYRKKQESFLILGMIFRGLQQKKTKQKYLLHLNKDLLSLDI